MLRGVIICTDKHLTVELQDALTETHRIGIIRSLDHYPTGVELTRFLRAAGPNVVFLSVEMVKIALELAARIEGQAPGTQIVVFDRACQPDTVLETMRAGIREFLSPPFEQQALQQSLQRLEQTLERKPPSIESTDAVMAFLPSKAGVGCSTVALNTSMMLAQLPDTKTLLADFDLNCGMVAFMLQMDSQHSITAAIENAHQLDENLWEKLVKSYDQLDVLPAGKLVPGFRIDVIQIRYLLEFARRNYKAICLDLSGILEKFSIEILHEANQIFMVCTPEVPSLHLARERLRFLRSLDLGDRVKILLNRAQRQTLIPIAEVEKLLELPVFMSFPNDYVGVHKAIIAGKNVNPASELGAGFRALAESIRSGYRPPQPVKRGFMKLLQARKEPEAEASVLVS
jgi:Flp pilus assembly CpaE family ATPase